MNEKQDIRAAVRSARMARARDAAATSRARDGFTRELTRAVEGLTAARLEVERVERGRPGLEHLAVERLVGEQLEMNQLRTIRIACFASTQGEPDTSEFLKWATSQGVEVLLPRALPYGMLEWSPLSAGPLRPGTFGIPEPTGRALANALHTVDAVFVPAAAIATDGTRLGWGLGYYDRELAALELLESPPRVFGVVFESEIFESLPAEPHDVPVNGVISEVDTRQLR